VYTEHYLKGATWSQDGDLFLYGDQTLSLVTKAGVIARVLMSTDLSSLPVYNDVGHLENMGQDRLLLLLNGVVRIVDAQGRQLARYVTASQPKALHLSRNQAWIWVASPGTVSLYRR
jgi:hypothetical protein